MDTIRVNPHHITDVKDLKIDGSARIVFSAGVPGARIPDFAGQIYVRTDGNVIYMSYGAASGNWKIIGA